MERLIVFIFLMDGIFDYLKSSFSSIWFYGKTDCPHFSEWMGRLRGWQKNERINGILMGFLLKVFKV